MMNDLNRIRSLFFKPFGQPTACPSIGIAPAEEVRLRIEPSEAEMQVIYGLDACDF